MTWEQVVIDMKNKGSKWIEIATAIKEEFPTLTDIQRIDKARNYYRSNSINTQHVSESEDGPTFHKSVEYKKDGSAIFEGIIELAENTEITPELMLKAHRLDSSSWEVVSYKNNFWQTQKKGGEKLVLYQSKIMVKPLSKDNITFEDIDNYFMSRDFNISPETTYEYSTEGDTLEIDLTDLHSGLLSWEKETGNNYDLKIAEKNFKACISDIYNRATREPIKKILFVTMGDILHVDNDNQTTTRGTFQQVDGRISKIYDTTLDMLIWAFELLKKVAPIEVVYCSGNHDRVLGYTLIKSAEMAFRNDNAITFDVAHNPLKYRQFGKVLIGFAHGEMPKKNIGTWLSGNLDSRESFGKSKYIEVHTGHRHSQSTMEESYGVIVRTMPPLCASSLWEHGMAFGDSVKSIVCYIWNDELGLRNMWFNNL